MNRFKSAQERDYERAFSEIQSGHKVSHWMWYIFPQPYGLGRSETSKYYGIRDLREAQAYLEDRYLNDNLVAICNELLKLDTSDARLVFGHPDDMKLKSSMTLFSYISEKNSIFQKVLDKYFDGKDDKRTLGMLKTQNIQ